MTPELLPCAREALLQVLGIRFGSLPEMVESHVENIKDPALLKSLYGRAFSARTLDDFLAQMADRVAEYTREQRELRPPRPQP